MEEAQQGQEEEAGGDPGAQWVGEGPTEPGMGRSEEEENKRLKT